MRFYKYHVTVNGNSQSPEEYLEYLKTYDIARAVLFRETGEGGRQHYHAALESTHPIVFDLGPIGGGRIQQHTEQGRMLEYISKSSSEPLLQYMWEDWKKDRQRYRTDAARAERDDGMDMMVATPKQMLAAGMSPVVIARTIKAREEVKDMILTESVELVNEMDLEFVDYDEPDELFKFNYNYDSEVLVDPDGVQRIGVRCIWLCGPTGCGKTYQMNKMLQLFSGYHVSDPENWKGYHGQQLIGWNEFNPNLASPMRLRELFDINKVNVKYGNATINPKETFWIITSNYAPNHAWDALLSKDKLDAQEETFKAILRTCCVLTIEGVYKPNSEMAFGGSFFGTIRRKRARVETEELSVEIPDSEESVLEKRLKMGDPELSRGPLGEIVETVKLGDHDFQMRSFHDGAWTPYNSFKF